MDAVYSILGYVVCHLCQCGACDGAHSIHRFSKIRNFRTPTNLYRFKAHMMEFHQSLFFVWVCMCMNCLHVCICRCMFIIIDDLVHRICSICLHLNFPVSIEHTLRRLSIIWVYLFIFRWKFKPRTIFVYGLSRWCDSFIQNHRNNYEHTCKIINTKKCITAAIPIQKCAIQNPLWYYTLCVYLKKWIAYYPNRLNKTEAYSTTSVYTKNIYWIWELQFDVVDILANNSIAMHQKWNILLTFFLSIICGYQR